MHPSLSKIKEEKKTTIYFEMLIWFCLKRPHLLYGLINVQIAKQSTHIYMIYVIIRTSGSTWQLDNNNQDFSSKFHCDPSWFFSENTFWLFVFDKLSPISAPAQPFLAIHTILTIHPSNSTFIPSLLARSIQWFSSFHSIIHIGWIQ